MPQNTLFFLFLAGVWEYIQMTRDHVNELESSVHKAKNNIEEINNLMSSWSKTPLFARYENKHETLLNLDDRKDRLEKRYANISDIGTKIHQLLQVYQLLSAKIVIKVKLTLLVVIYCWSYVD